jgi:2-polyprenyl-6-methoxyphenol hydroxylase-like FAD-dependent oxidoreductase
MHEQLTDVLVVGAGPVGLTLSIELGRRGIRHMLIDKGPREARSLHPRMDQVSIRSMEHIRRWGAVADVEAAGFPRDLPRDVVFTRGVLCPELEREPQEADATRAVPPFSPQKHELCPQNFFDPVLQKLAERSSTAEVLYETRLVDFVDTTQTVIADVEKVQTGERSEVAARFLVGCDGANSWIAERLGLKSASQAVLAYSTNIFIECPVLAELTADRRAYRYILVGREGVWASMVNMNGRDVWRLQVLGGLEWPTWTQNEARAAIDAAIGEKVEYELKSIVPWARNERVLERFSVGPCFVAGDAAHQLSPTGAYGMTTGMAEAIDLGWKLAAVIQGWGGEHLLYTYDLERRPVAIRNAQRGTVNFERMRTAIRGQLALAVGESPEDTAKRIGHALRTGMAEEWESMGIHLGYSYGHSPIICAGGEPAPHSHPARYVQSARPGARAPHVWLADGRSILDLFGDGFTLLVFRRDTHLDGVVQAAKARRVPLRIEHIDNQQAAALYEKAMVLVRPDGHVAWRADTAPKNWLSIIDRVRGVATRCPS